MQFFADLALFTNQTAANLISQPATTGDIFFPFALPSALALEGDSSGLWEESSPATRTQSVIFYKQQSNIVFILGSLTLAGLRPVLFSFDELSSPFDIVLSGAEFRFVGGQAGVTVPDGFNESVVGLITPEPSSVVSVVCCLAFALFKLRTANLPNRPRL